METLKWKIDNQVSKILIELRNRKIYLISILSFRAFSFNILNFTKHQIINEKNLLISLLLLECCNSTLIQLK